MNFNILCNIEKLSEFLILLSRLFHSTAMDGKYEFLKKSMPKFELSNAVDVSCSVFTPNVGMLLNRYLGDWLLLVFE